MSNDLNYTDIEEQSEEGQAHSSVRESISDAEDSKYVRKNNINENRRTKNTYRPIARGELPLTTISSNSNYKNKDLQNTIVEHFEGISNQTKSLQKALAHHRHDFNDHRHEFNLRMSNMEHLLCWVISKIEAHKATSLHKKPNQN